MNLQRLLFFAILVGQLWVEAVEVPNNCSSLEQRICYERFMSTYKSCILDDGEFKLSENEYPCPPGSECVSFGKEPCRSIERPKIPKIHTNFKLSERALQSILPPFNTADGGIRFFVAWYSASPNDSSTFTQNLALFPPIPNTTTSSTSTTSATTSVTSTSSTTASTTTTSSTTDSDTTTTSSSTTTSSTTATSPTTTSTTTTTAPTTSSTTTTTSSTTTSPTTTTTASSTISTTTTSAITSSTKSTPSPKTTRRP